MRERIREIIRKVLSEMSATGGEGYSTPLAFNPNKKADALVTVDGLFDVVEPPYNLISLGKTYELSSANFAAINAKVANIVGLGFDLELTLPVKQKLEDKQGPKLQYYDEDANEWVNVESVTEYVEE